MEIMVFSMKKINVVLLVKNKNSIFMIMYIIVKMSVCLYFVICIVVK